MHVDKSITASRNPRNAGTCGIFDVGGRLGQAHRHPRHIQKLVAELIDKRGFPAPLPNLCNGELTDKVTKDSRWLTELVDAWFDDVVPAALRPAVAAAHTERTAGALADRARALQ